MKNSTTPSRRSRYVAEQQGRQERIARQWQAATKTAEIVRDEDGMIYFVGGAK
jgi:hypothetical protein